MTKTAAEEILDRGIGLLAEFLPGKTYLYFPFLYTACVWAMRRVFDLRERIFAWQAWLEPELIEKKPNTFVLDFFRSQEGLEAVYAEEIKNGDIKSLRKSFSSLYPVCGLEDTFLKALFKPELEAGDYRIIDNKFRPRASRAVADAKALDGRTEFWDGLEALSMEMASVDIHLLSDSRLQGMIKGRIDKQLGRG